MIAGLVLAAGEGSRFGGPKQLAEFGGRPLLEHPLAALGAARLLDRRFLVVGAHRDEVLAGVELHGFEPVACADWRRGLSRSLSRGLAAASAAGARAALIVLGDQPLISPAAVDRLAGAWRGRPAAALRATYAGRPGHPVLLAASCSRLSTG